MGERRAKGVLAAAAIWIVIVAALAVAYRFLVHPHFTGKLAKETGSESRYRHKLALALDSFSGYCVLRSDAFAKELAAEGILLELADDGADYRARIDALARGTTPMAVFTIDSLLTASAARGEFPGTIVLVLDESRGADAIVARQGAVASLQDLDSPDARLVLTPDSPSEFLARVVLAHFSLPRLPPDWRIPARGAEDVYHRFRAASPAEKRAYVLWEPHVSKALAAGAHVLLDSSRIKGYIVDVLVVQRKFLREAPDVVTTVVAAYLRAAHAYSRDPKGMETLVAHDARMPGAEGLTAPQAAALSAGIRWKNTLENYAHFGLLPPEAQGGLDHIEDMIANITTVLVKTGALPRDPLEGRAHTMFHSAILAGLKAAGFHPEQKLAILEGAPAAPLEAIRAEETLRPLSDAQWERIAPVAELGVDPISFARGSARIHISSTRELARIAGLLRSWPRYYLAVMGHSRTEGDPEANLRLARERAQAAADAIIGHGIPAARVRVRTAPPSRTGGEAQSVSFIIGQQPY